MFKIDCLPFSKGLTKESLSYFSAKNLRPGTLVKVKLRTRNVPAIVLKSTSVLEAKTEIKSANFRLKKVSAGNVVVKPFLQEEFFEAVEECAKYFASNPGNIFSHLIPAFVLENPSILSILKTNKIQKSKNNIKKNISILQSPDEERFIHYRSLIREEFARKKSIFLCLPQNEDIKYAKEKLEKGIESYVCLLHNDMEKKKLKEEWKKAYTTSHPVLIIATARWLFLPREDIGTIVIDKENRNGWKTLSRPFIDLRTFAEILAKQRGIHLVLGDTFLRTETLYRYKQGELYEFENVKWRLMPEFKITIADMREVTKKEREFKILSPEIREFIKEIADRGSHMFIFAARKGLSSVIICRDCGEQVRCSNCSSPVILYRAKASSGQSTETGGIFKCHQCGEVRDAAEVCQNCQSWKLEAYGVGIDMVSEEIKKEISGVSLFEIHKDITPTSIKASDTAQKFYDTKSSLLLGTEMAFPYLRKKVSYSAIVSFDSLFSIPDFRIKEKIFGIILQTRDMAREKFLIQSRNPEDPVVKFAVSGNLLEFYKKEIEDRRLLNYPPFGIFIKITVRGTKGFVSREAERLQKALKNFESTIFNSIQEKKGGQAAINAVIKLKRENWPDQNLIKILKFLPPHFEIKIDPDSLL
ncbi:MAG: hypothetical protein JW740_03375 [Candidatus Zambryskibacteria bacterium]|nr:hypothetical protein [Candidatus Zambryskibacteria bacterium]